MAHYAAAWILSTDTLVKLNLPRYDNATASAFTLEDGTYIVTKLLEPLHTLNVMDFYVEHLSYYGTSLQHDDVEMELHSELKNVLHKRLHFLDQSFPGRPKLDNVLVIAMYYSGQSTGEKKSQSNGEDRPLFLNITHKSFEKYFTHFAVFCENDVDYEFLANESQLEFFDVVRINGLIDSIHLPVATVLETHRRLQPDGVWHGQFEYVFFTEPDNIVQIDDIHRLLASLNSTSVFVPHRLQPFEHPNDFSPGFASKLGLIRNSKIKFYLRSIQRHATTSLPAKCCYPSPGAECEKGSRTQFNPILADKNVTSHVFPDPIQLLHVGGAYHLINGAPNKFKANAPTCHARNCRD